MRYTIYPWDFRSWRSAFRISGVPGIALFFLLLGAMLQVGDSSGSGAGHSSAGAILLIRTPAITIAFLLLLMRPRIATMRFTDLRVAYAAFAGLYLLSALWSEQRVQTIGKAAELLLAGMAFYETSQLERPLARIEALRTITLLTMSTLGVFAVIGFLARVPTYVQNRAGLLTSTTASAPFLSGNGLGYVSSALFLVVFAEWQAKRIPLKFALPQLTFALALFSVSASRTSFVILLLSILLVLCKRSKMMGVFAVGAVAVCCLLFFGKILIVLQGKQVSSNFATLSGRTVVWDAAIRQFETHPILGVGGGVGGKEVIAHIGNTYLEEMSSLHNGFLELLTGLGAIGFLIGCSMLVRATWRTWFGWNAHPEFAGTYVLILHVWMTTTMSTGILGWMGYEVALFLCIITNLDLLAERSRAFARVELAPVRWRAEALTANAPVAT